MKIVAAAIRVGEMIASIPAPARHGHVLGALYTLNQELVIEPEDQGFLTSAGKFVCRKEAKRIASAAGQLLPREAKLPHLYSEDVW